AEMVFPNGLAFDASGKLFVTDSAAGALFRVSPDGTVDKWVTSELLAGNKDACGPGKGVGVPFNIGANGIVRKADAFYVTNTDKATVVRVRIRADGTAGTPEVFAGPDCDALGGADGLTVDPQGNLLVADNHLNKIVRIDGAGHVAPAIEGSPLDFPASLAFE